MNAAAGISIAGRRNSFAIRYLIKRLSLNLDTWKHLLRLTIRCSDAPRVRNLDSLNERREERSLRLRRDAHRLEQLGGERGV